MHAKATATALLHVRPICPNNFLKTLKTTYLQAWRRKVKQSQVSLPVRISAGSLAQLGSSPCTCRTTFGPRL